MKRIKSFEEFQRAIDESSDDPGNELLYHIVTKYNVVLTKENRTEIIDKAYNDYVSNCRRSMH